MTCPYCGFMLGHEYDEPTETLTCPYYGVLDMKGDES